MLTRLIVKQRGQPRLRTKETQNASQHSRQRRGGRPESAGGKRTFRVKNKPDRVGIRLALRHSSELDESRSTIIPRTRSARLVASRRAEKKERL